MSRSDDRLMIDYRVRVIHTGLVVSWMAFAVFTIWSLSLTGPDREVALLSAGAFGVAMAILTFIPWRDTIQSTIADWLITVWCISVLIGQLVIELRAVSIPTAVGFLVVPFFAAATAVQLSSLLVVNIAAICSYWAALGASGGYVSSRTSTAMLAFVGVIVFVTLISIRIRVQIEESSSRYSELASRESDLAEKERELTRLYDVSLAIGAGTKLTDVLPELVGRVADSVGARVGLVMLYDPASETLQLMSPIWVAGSIVPADEFVVALNEPGLPQRVFMSGKTGMINDPMDRGQERLADELQAERLAVVSLRVEDRSIGVLMVGDKETPFTDEDLETLEGVAAPASLVLNQITRYEAARDMGERMAELAQMKTDFVSVVSHELRTPLTSIIGALSTLQRPELVPEDPRARQLIDMASKQSNRLRTLIEDLLVMSRIEAASLPVRPGTIDVAVFLDDLITVLPGGDRVRLEVAPGIGSIVADPDHLARTMTNLVENALKYGGNDVMVSVTEVGGETRLRVIDHGPGIPYEKHDVVFERFTQLQPNETRSKGGAGLGLSIVKGLVEAMGGRVWFEPTVGGGATFTVAIPGRSTGRGA
ncbi:MAG: ATP-binding protein [Acidimicrobiia bacterium]